ncbi:MAG TPA: C1 family peptidase, partial [Geomobilimonas sp.]|nr:C1 family peptidase [Geomobilimonas sp.]
MAKTINVTRSGRTLNVRPDTLDFRDRVFAPTLVEVPSVVDLKDYRKTGVPILDQGTEGACTGFGLATVVNYLLRMRKVVPDKTAVSPWMLYQLARRYDEWSGENYDGSSARGAMKGWHKHGVCTENLWKKGGSLTPHAADDGAARPLGAYYRVNHKDLVAMHSAITEVGILYATSTVHAGWEKVKKNGIIPMSDDILGGHAFAIVAYDKDGFWLQNSWGPAWGKEGFAHISYDDWLANGTDVWVARLGAPVAVKTAAAVATRHSSATSYTDAFSLNDLRRHIVSIGNDGCLRTGGTYGTGEDEVHQIFEHHIPHVTAGWKNRRILLYAHGGLVDETSSVQRLADYLPALLRAEVYPVSFIWHSDFWTTLTNILKDAVSRRRPEGFLDATKDFMLDRLDDALEPIARIPGKMMWDEMKENARLATSNEKGGARFALASLAKLVATDPATEVHVVGHSAGSIFHAPLIQELTGRHSQTIESCTLWAPACTVELFKQSYLPAITAGRIKRFA